MINTDYLKKFGVAVREQRLKQGFSQETLAEISGLHRTYIGGIERGERNISLLNVVKLAQALNLSPAQLLAAVEAFE
jgi:transcriptional regulator with XRE-family HTH domain